MTYFLPPANTVRWVARRKAQVVRAIKLQTLTFDDALERYGLSEEELRLWILSYEVHGLNALRVASIRQYRKATHFNETG